MVKTRSVGLKGSGFWLKVTGLGLGLLATVGTSSSSLQGADFNLSTIDGDNGFIINGPSTNSFAGRSIDFIGDINGDGLSDIILTTPYSSPLSRNRAGEAYVIFGSAIWGSGTGQDPLAGGFEFNLATLLPSQGFRLRGATAQDNLGYDAAGIGDINGDGLADFAVTAIYGELSAAKQDQGEVYVLFGSDFWSSGTVDDPTLGTGSLDLALLQAGDGFVVRGEAGYDLMGQDVSSAGDLNDDGIGDLVIGTRLAGTVAAPQCGKAYVIFGSTQLGKGGGLDPLSGGVTWNNSRFNGDAGFIIQGYNTQDYMGRSVAGIGDFNADGRDDVALGVSLFDTATSNEGRVSIVFGNTNFGNGTAGDPLAGGNTLLLAGLSESYGFAINGTSENYQFGMRVAPAGDINNDGRADLLVGSPEGGNTAVIGDREGNAFIILGNSNYATNLSGDPVASGVMSLTSRLGFEVFQFQGAAGVDRLGYAIDGVGDLTGDGLPDVAFGIPLSDFSNPDAGRVLLIPGSVNFGDNSVNDPLAGASTISLATFPATLGKFYNGIAGNLLLGGDEAGSGVAGGFDFNGDTAPDLLISAPFANGGFTRSGETYLVLGTPSSADTTPPVLVSTTATNPSGTYPLGFSFTIELNFSEPILFDSNLGTPTLALNSGGTATYSTGNGTQRLYFNYTVAAGENTNDLDITSFQLNGTAIKDVPGNTGSIVLPTGVNSLGGSRAIQIDSLVPELTRITTTSPSGVYSEGGVLTLQLEFTEPVTSVNPAQINFNLNSGGVAYYLSGNGTNVLSFVYNIDWNENANPLEVETIPVGIPSLRDAAGNSWSRALPTQPINQLSGSSLIVVDTAVPLISRITTPLADGYYGIGDEVLIDLELNENVNVSLFGLPPVVTLNNGAFATYLSQQATSILRFRYVIGTNQDTTDLDVLNFESEGGLFLDQVGLPLLSGTAIPTGPDSLAGSSTIAIDSIVPRVLSVSSTLPNGAYGLGVTIPIIVSLSESVEVTGNPIITLSNGDTATYAGGTATQELTFNYVVISGGDSSLLDSVSLASASGIKDLAGNALNPSIPTTSTLADNRSISIDSVAPFVSFTPLDPFSLQGSETNFADVVLGFDIQEFSTPLGGLDFFEANELLLTNATLEAVDTVFNTLTFSPITDGPVSIQMPSGRFTDAAGNGNTASNIISFVSDQTGPTVNLTSSEITSGATTNQLGDFEFSLEVIGASPASVFNPQNPSHLSLINCTASAATRVDDTYTFSLTPGADGLVSAQVLAGALFDQAGNSNASSSVFSFTRITEPPSATLSSTVASGSITNAATISFDTTFSGGTPPYTGFNPLLASDVVVTNATVSQSLAEQPLGFTVTPTADGIVTVQIASGAITDAASNPNEASNVYSFTRDSTPPTATLSSSTINSGDIRNTFAPVSMTVSFTDATTLTAFNPQNPAHLSLTNVVASSAVQVGNSYSFTLTPQGDGACSAQVLAGAVIDAAGNGSFASATFTFTLSTSLPSASLSSTTASGAFTTASTISFNAAFSGGLSPYTGFNPLLTSDVLVTNATVSQSLAEQPLGFTVTPTADGVVTIQIPAGAITDAASNPNTSSTIYSFTRDTTPPSVALSSSTINSGDVRSSLDPLSMTVSFTDATTLTTFNPQNPAHLSLTNLTASTVVQVGNSYSFTLTPQTEGACSAQVLAGAVIDAAGNASLASATFAFTVSTSLPSASLSSTVASGSFTNAATTPFNALFSGGLSPYTGFNPLLTSDVLVTNATVSQSPAEQPLGFTVTPTADGIVTVQVASGAITDAASNPNAASNVYSFTKDSTAPAASLTSSTINSGDIRNSFAPVSMNVSFTDATTLTTFNPQNSAHLSLTNVVASSAVQVGNSYSFTLIPQADGACSAQVLAGAVTDAAGNGSLASTTFAFTVSSALPSASLSSTTAADGFTTASTIVFNAAFSGGLSPYTGFNPLLTSDVLVTNATVSQSPAEQPLGFTVTPTADGVVTVQIASGAISDAASNPNSASTIYSFTLDQSVPVVSLDSSVVLNGSLTNISGPIGVEVVVMDSTSTSEFDPQNSAQLLITNATASTANRVGNTYSFSLTPIADGNVSAQVLAGAVTDAAGNGNMASAVFGFNRDTIAPTVVEALAFTGTSPTSHEPLEFTVRFDEPLVGFNTSDVVVSADAAVGSLSLSIQPGSQNSYTLQVSGMQESGAITVTILAAQLTDVAGNPVSGPNPSVVVDWIALSAMEEWMILSE